MDRKILVGSIIAVAILVLVSFTSVVGYSSVKSTTGKESPLFNIRTNRAIGKEDQVLTSNHVGKGNTLPFPKRDDKEILTQKAVDIIRMIDDKTFDKFIASIIASAQKDKRFNDVSPDEIREALYQVRNSDEPILIFDADTENKEHMWNIMFTVHTGCWTYCCTFGHGFLGIRNCIRDLVYNIGWLLYYLTQMISFIWCGL